MFVLKAHSKPVYALVFSPDGRFLVSSSGDETVRAWSVSSTELVGEWPGSSFAAPLAISPDSRLIARGGRGVRVWSFDQPNEVLVDALYFCESVAFSPDGKIFVTHGGNEGFCRWTIPSGKQLPGRWGGTRILSDGKQYPTGGVAFSPDGTMVATVFGVLGTRGYDSMVYLWNSKRGDLEGELRSEFANANPQVIAFSPDGQYLAGAYGPAIAIWDLAARRQVAVRKPGKKHFKDLAFTPDGRHLVTVSNDRSARLWDTGTWNESGGFEWKIGKLGAVAVSADGLRMAAGGDTGKIVMWDVDT